MADGCGRVTVGRGLCSSHYYKATRAGTLDQVAPNPSGPCEHCGQQIPTGRRWGSRFCSKDCKQAFSDAAVSARLLAARNAKPRFCAWCREPLAAVKRGNARFCSPKCDTDWHNHEKAAVKRRSTLAARKPCEVCGGEIPAARRGHAVYCSPACKERARLTASPQARVRQLDENLRRVYGITTADYEALLAGQGGRCAICGTTEPKGKGRFHVDHCHESNVVRGLLCHHCNLGLGNFKDDTERLRGAISYLGQHAPAMVKGDALVWLIT